MPDAREVFEMVTKNTGPDQGALQRQHEGQERRRRRQRIGAVAVAAAVIAALAIFFLTNPAAKDNGRPAGQVTTSPPPVAPAGVATMSPAFVDLHGTVASGVDLPPDAWEPSLSQDGRWIVYVTNSPDIAACTSCAAGARIVVSRLDGSGARYLTQYGGPGISGVDQPVFSPDATRVAFVARGANDHGAFTSNVFVIDADGSGMRQLTYGPAQKGWPSWSPDGTHILYDDAGSEPLDDSGFSHTQEIFRIDVDGAGTPKRITHNHVDDAEAVYAADGASIALFHDGGVAVMDPDGAQIQMLPGADGFAPRWSPDGTRIAFLRYNSKERFELDDATGVRSSWPRLDVKLIDLATGEVSDLGLSVASDVNAVSWTPDSKALLVNRASNPSG